MRLFKGIFPDCKSALPVILAILTWAAAANSQPAIPAFDVLLDDARKAHLAALGGIDGRPLDLRQLEDRVVLVSFFASWCPPCNAEFEHMKLLQFDHAADGLTVVAVNLFENFAGFEDDGKRLTRFLTRHAPVFSVVRGTAETAKLFGGVVRIPTVYVFGRDGRPRLRFVHAPGAKKTNPGLEELRAAVRNALGRSAAGLVPEPATPTPEAPPSPWSG